MDKAALRVLAVGVPLRRGVRALAIVAIVVVTALVASGSPPPARAKTSPGTRWSASAARTAS